ncbi:MAG TPA: PAS domain S-box protein, partial [Holophaga sp.]|nr:PAS domain S-box protein [Holophaga sp.]
HWWRAAYPDPACREQAERLWDDAIARASAAGDGIVQTERTFDVMCLDGSTRTVEIRGTLLGERVLVVFNDLTERVKDEQRVRDALALSEKLLATMPLGVAAYQGLSGRCVLANAAILQIVGGTLDYHLSQDFRQIRQWQETGLLAVAERALGTGEDQQIEVHALTRAGRDCWLACSLSSFQSGGAPHLLALVSDVTARRQAEETLRASEARFRTLTEQAPIPLFVQQDDVYVYCNPAALRLLHAPDEAAVLGRPSLDIVHPDDRPGTGEVIQQRREGRLRTDRHPERFVALDGAIIDVEVIGAPISLGGRAAMLVFAEDVTARNRDERLRRTLEQELNRSQKLQSLGSLAGGVAHDMNNVLGAILNLATLHRDKAPEGSPLRQSMETIARACLRGGTMVKGLLGFAREGLAEERPLDLNELVREEVALLERTTLQKVRLEMDLAEGLRAVIGDASALAHALMNLCVNAVDAMPDGGTLSIRTGNEPGGTVLLAVGDTGCGMPAEVMEKALDPFFTTKPQGKGTGLGLSIVYGTVKAHGGQLQLKSAPGEGTVVEIRLPAWTAGPAPAPPEEAPDRAQRSKRILVVDDDELIQDSIHLLLEALGHQPVVAGSGEEALAALEAGSAFDVVILDLNMPGLGGARTLQRIRELRPALPVLLATGRADRQAVELVRTVPQVTLLAKPFSLEDLRTGLGE